MATYSERIRELRVLHGMSQQDLADRLDVNNHKKNSLNE